jgi:hypothetical protein
VSQGAREICRAVRDELEQATDSILSAADQGARAIRRARSGEPAALSELEGVFCAILEACTFQDLVGQRLSQLEDLLGDAVTNPALAVDPLLNGPAAAGQGLDQAAADGLMRTLFPAVDRTRD